MDPLKVFRHFATWYVLGYLVVVLGGAYVVANIRHEQRVREYRLCQTGNQSRQDINERFDRLDQVFVRLAPDSPALRRFLAEEKASELKPRSCVKP